MASPSAASGVTVRVAWLPRVPRLLPRFMGQRTRVRDWWRRRRRRGSGPSADWLEVGGEDGIWYVVLAVLGAVLVVLLLWFLVLPVLFWLVDAVVVVLVAGAVVVTRVLFRRPWRIEMVRDGEVVGTTSVVGWRAARARCEEMRAALAAGVAPHSLVDP